MNNGYFEVNTVCVALLVLLFIHDKRTQAQSSNMRTFGIIIICVIGALFADLLYYFIEGKVSFIGLLCHYLIDVIYFLLFLLASYFWLKYVREKLYEDKEVTRFQRFIFAIPMLLASVIIVISPITGYVFSITDDNYYVRGDLYLLQPIVTYGYMVLAVVASFVQYRKEKIREKKRTCLILGGYAIIPLIGSAFQIEIIGFNLALPSITVAVVMLYIESLNKQVSLDPLTQLNNRGKFDIFAQSKLESSVKENLYLVIIDIDNFKSINDKEGHVEGDKALIRVAKVLKKEFASSDAFLCRYGGDEFVIVIECSEKDVLRYIKRINNQLEKEAECLPYNLELSYGYEKYSSSKINTIDDFVNLADKKMYQNKQAKKNEDNSNIV